MNFLQKQASQEVLPQTVNPHQLRVARQLSEAMADVQAKELLSSDVLFKVGNLATIQEEILKNNPEAKEYTDYILRAFTYYSSQYLK